MRDLIPWGRSRAPARQGEPLNDAAAVSPFLTLRREMDRLFDDAFRGFGLSAFNEGGISWPKVEVVDRDKEVRVTAELPGLEEQDVELRVEDNVLILRGEKRAEFDDAERQYTRCKFSIPHGRPPAISTNGGARG